MVSLIQESENRDNRESKMKDMLRNRGAVSEVWGRSLGSRVGKGTGSRDGEE